MNPRAATALASTALFVGGCFLFGPAEPEPGPRPGPAGTPTRAALRCWAMSEAAEVDPESPEPPDGTVWTSRQKSIALAGAAGEVLGFQLILAGDDRPRTDVAVRFAPLVQLAAFGAPAEGEIPAAAFAAFQADWVQVRKFRPWYTAETGRPPGRRLFADLLTPVTGALTVPAGRHRPVFVDLEIPAAAPAGDYRGHIEVTAGSAQPVRLEVRLEVWPFPLTGGRSALPAVSRVDVARLRTWEADGPEAAGVAADALMNRSSAEAGRTRTALAAALALLRDHGIRPIPADVRPRVEFQWPGRATIDWTAYDAFLDTFLPADSARPREPLAAPISVGFPDPAAFEPGPDPIPGADKPAYVYYEQALRDYSRQIAAHLSERGRLGTAVVFYDPPAQSGPAIQLARASRFAAVLGEGRPNLPVVVPFSPRWVKVNGGSRAEPALNVLTAAVGVWRPGAPWFDPPAADPAAGARAPMWLAPSEPPLWPAGRVESPRSGIVAWGWASRRYRPDALDIGPACAWRSPGAADRKAWARDAEEPASADTLSFDPEGESPWLYPGGPRPSLRLKLVRRALQDFRYLQLLEKAVGPQRAETPARALVRFALAEGGPPAEGRSDGWSRSADDYEQVRREVGRTIADWYRRGRPSPELFAAGESWEKFLARNDRVELEVLSHRLTLLPEKTGAGGSPAAARLDVRVRLRNLGARARDDLGSIALRGLAMDWQVGESAAVRRLEPGAAAETALSALRVGGANAETLPDAALHWVRPSGDRIIPIRFRRQVSRAVLLPPTIDGRLEEWTNRAEGAADAFVGLHARRSRNDVLEPAGSVRRTAVQSVHDEQYLYFGFDCPREAGEPPAAQPGNRAERHGGALWAEDAVELVLAPPVGEPAEQRLYRITVKSNGAVEAATGPDGRLPTEPWPAEVRAACGADERAWRCEVRVPWSAFGGKPRAGTVWGVNYSRHVAAAGETSAWSPAAGHIFRTEHAGLLILR